MPLCWLKEKTFPYPAFSLFPSKLNWICVKNLESIISLTWWNNIGNKLHFSWLSFSIVRVVTYSLCNRDTINVPIYLSIFVISFSLLPYHLKHEVSALILQHAFYFIVSWICLEMNEWIPHTAYFWAEWVSLSRKVPNLIHVNLRYLKPHKYKSYLFLIKYCDSWSLIF